MSLRFFGVPSGVYNVRENESLKQEIDHKEPTILCRVFFLDDTQEMFEIDTKAKGQFLLDKVTEHLELVEKGYFGLEFLDSFIGSQEWKWLDPTKSVRKQAQNNPYPYIFYFKVKFFAADPEKLYEEYTRYHFFLHLKRDLRIGKLITNHADQYNAILLASYVVQSELGDYDQNEFVQTSNHNASDYIARIDLIPDQTLEVNAKIMDLHKNHKGHTPADAEYNFLCIAKTLETYGVQMYEALDENNVAIQLAVSCAGVLAFQNIIKINTFSWKSILRISFKKKFFYLHIQENTSSMEADCSLILKFDMNDGNSCKNFWKSCIEHHTFFRLLDPPPPVKKNIFFSFGSKQYRYSGRTEHQTILEYKKRIKIDRIFTRNSGKSSSVRPPHFNHNSHSNQTNHRNSVGNHHFNLSRIPATVSSLVVPTSHHHNHHLTSDHQNHTLLLPNNHHNHTSRTESFNSSKNKDQRFKSSKNSSSRSGTVSPELISDNGTPNNIHNKPPPPKTTNPFMRRASLIPALLSSPFISSRIKTHYDIAKVDDKSSAANKAKYIVTKDEMPKDSTTDHNHLSTNSSHTNLSTLNDHSKLSENQETKIAIKKLLSKNIPEMKKVKNSNKERPTHGLLKFATTLPSTNNGEQQPHSPKADDNRVNGEIRLTGALNFSGPGTIETNDRPKSMRYVSNAKDRRWTDRRSFNLYDKKNVESNRGVNGDTSKIDCDSRITQNGDIDYFKIGRSEYPTLEKKRFDQNLSLERRKPKKMTEQVQNSSPGNTVSRLLYHSNNVKSTQSYNDSNNCAANYVDINMVADKTGKYGFNIKGGSDQDLPVIVSKIALDTPADKAFPRLNEGDQIVYINRQSVNGLTHEQVINLIVNSPNRRLNIVVIPNVYVGDLEDDLDISCPPNENSDKSSLKLLNGNNVDRITTSSEIRIITKKNGNPENGVIEENDINLYSKVSENIPARFRLGESMKLMECSLVDGVLIKQFQQLYRRKPGLTTKMAKLPQNAHLNRYKDISPYDQTRVFINDTSCGTSYINANYINMEISNTGIINRYIAAQGPLPQTIAHFWQMIWEQQSSLIIMLTTEVEQGRVKCNRYWPETKDETGNDGATTLNLADINLKISQSAASKEGGHENIYFSQMDNRPLYIVRTFSIHNTALGEEREVTQMQYLQWPDHGTPKDPSDFISFVNHFRKLKMGSSEPAVIHCSAGIGRTGVLILMETGMSLIEAYQPVYAWEIVKVMRDQRCMLIQTTSQYKFVCEALLKVWKEGIIQPNHELLSLPNSTAQHNFPCSYNSRNNVIDSNYTYSSKFKIMNINHNPYETTID
ncbi:tyrosine-protein phosphatase non-receptor type 4-like isoform X2 [Gordionus sp. m RMFG-2023]|uniref:tyrosine-protein phosphatase non-receptor type 4-like isoform X2 n=1 Tax=Gordionus sp. m RMFG-2023 TaxID=3053472 RepID=UPI0031FC43AF